MEQFVQNDQEQTTEQEYIQGFNDAALMAQFEPELYSSVALVDSETVSAYFEGFLDFKEYLKQEAFIDKQMDELSALRNNEKEKEDDLERW
jgi:adenine-specific DNA methylase